jgi:hypothetical protein
MDQRGKTPDRKKNHRGHGCLSVVSVVCCQVEVSATGWSLVERSPTECGVFKMCVIVKLLKMRRPRPPRGCRAIEKLSKFNVGYQPFGGIFCLHFMVETSFFFLHFYICYRLGLHSVSCPPSVDIMFI